MNIIYIDDIDDNVNFLEKKFKNDIVFFKNELESLDKIINNILKNINKKDKIVILANCNNYNLVEKIVEEVKIKVDNHNILHRLEFYILTNKKLQLKYILHTYPHYEYFTDKTFDTDGQKYRLENCNNYLEIFKKLNLYSRLNYYIK